MLVILQFKFIAPLIVVVHYFVFEAKGDAGTLKRSLSDANEGRERASSSNYDVFSGFKVKIGWSKDNVNPRRIENGENGLELGNI